MIVSSKKRREFLIGKTRDYGDAHFDPNKRLVRVENGLHPIRNSFWYAISLFEDGSEEVFERAEAIVWAVLGQQEKRANHPRKGAFKLWEEDSEPVDPDWADFNVCNLPEMLFCHGQRLSPELVEASLESPETALENVVQRDVFLKYTNMILLSCEAAILGGELLGNDSFVDHGWEKLKS